LQKDLPKSNKGEKTWYRDANNTFCPNQNWGNLTRDRVTNPSASGLTDVHPESESTTMEKKQKKTKRNQRTEIIG
jgi:hypothetical protein